MAGQERISADARLSGTLRIVVNGEARAVRAHTLAQLLEDLGYGGQKVATACNGEFVAGPARAGRLLAAGDQIEIVAPRQGG